MRRLALVLATQLAGCAIFRGPEQPAGATAATSGRATDGRSDDGGSADGGVNGVSGAPGDGGSDGGRPGEGDSGGSIGGAPGDGGSDGGATGDGGTTAGPLPTPAAAEHPDAPWTRELGTRLIRAFDDCGGANDTGCLCGAVSHPHFTPSPAGAARIVRWPLPGTRSGSATTDVGTDVVPLGPVFEIAIDASGAVTACGVKPTPSAAGAAL